VRGIALLWLSLCGQACGLSSRLQDPIPIATKVVGHDIQALLAEALAKRQQSPDSGDDRYEDDSEEMEKLREQLEGQYDQWLEDAALKAFKVSLAHPAGKRYVLYKARSKTESEEYAKADDAKKRDMIEKWLKGKYDSYMDTRGESANRPAKQTTANPIFPGSRVRRRRKSKRTGSVRLGRKT
jgi:hypothetical protein